MVDILIIPIIVMLLWVSQKLSRCLYTYKVVCIHTHTHTHSELYINYISVKGWKKHKLESRLPGEISITLDMQMTPPLWQKVKKN